MAQIRNETKTNKKEIIEDIFNLIEKAESDIKKANKIDIKNKNGFKIDLEKIQKIENKIIEIEADKIKNIGTICVIYDGNTYCLLEIALEAILTGNSVILTSEIDYMKATNELILTLIRRVLEENGIDQNLIQKLYTHETEELLSNSASINKVIAIGNRDFQERIKKMSGIEVVCSGYGNYDIYIEDTSKINQIQQETDQNEHIQYYVKTGVKVPFKEYIEVQDIDEAVALINYNTAGYNSSIFTNDEENEEEFLKDIKSDHTIANQSPFLNDILDMNINEFSRTKNIEIDKKPEYDPEEADKIKAENVKLKAENQTLIAQNNVLKEDNQTIRNDNLVENQKKDDQIKQLTKQLQESQNLAKKYMEIFKTSKLSRVFGNLTKEDIEKDKKMLT